MNARFHVLRAGKRYGPFTGRQLKDLAKEVTLRPDDQITQDGKNKSVAASSVRGLFPSEELGAEPIQPPQTTTASPESANTSKTVDSFPESEPVARDFSVTARTVRNHQQTESRSQSWPTLFAVRFRCECGKKNRIKYSMLGKARCSECRQPIFVSKADGKRLISIGFNLTLVAVAGIAYAFWRISPREFEAYTAQKIALIMMLTGAALILLNGVFNLIGGIAVTSFVSRTAPTSEH